MKPTPDQISAHLRHIAVKIDNSKSPDADLVKREINKVVAAITHETRIQRIAAEIYRLAIEEIEVGPWDTEEAKGVEQALEFAKGKQEPEDIQGGLKIVKSRIDQFIKYLSGLDTDEVGKYLKDVVPDPDVMTSAPEMRDIK
jgi:hypothetical protein